MFCIVDLISSRLLMPASAQGHYMFNPIFSVHATALYTLKIFDHALFLSFSTFSLFPFDLPFLTTSSNCYVDSKLKPSCMTAQSVCSLEGINLIMLRSNGNLNIELYLVSQKHNIHKLLLAVALFMRCLPMYRAMQLLNNNNNNDNNNNNNNKQQQQQRH